LRPLPFPESERLASLYFREDSSIYNSLSYPDYVYYRDHNDVFSGLAVSDGIDGNLRFGDETEAVSGEIVSANYFSVLGVSPLLGRAFAADEDAVPGRDPVLMLGYGLWRRRFGGDPAAIGRQVVLNGVSFTVIGIAPPGFGGLVLDRKERPEFWVPTMMYTAVVPMGDEFDLEHLWTDDWLSATGRLKPGVTYAQAESDFAHLTGQLRRTVWLSAGKGSAQRGAVLVPANAAKFPPDSRKLVARFLGMLMAVVGLVLLIACSNVASLMLARLVKRRREIGVRLALGAGRGRIFQQLLTESLLLSLMGGAAGLAVAYLTSELLASLERPFQMQLLLETGLDARVLVFALALSVVTGILFGMIPLRQSARFELTTALKADAGHFRRRRFDARSFLVVVQIALSLVLLAGAGLFVRTLRSAQATDVTRDPGKVLLLKLDLARRKYDEARGERFYAGLLDRLHAVPGVRSAAVVYVVPMGGWRGGTDIVVHSGDRPVQVDFNAVSEEYFQTVGLPIVRGRGFDRRDREGAPRVAIVNERMAQKFWPGEDPVGKQIRLTQPARLAEIVGVVRDGRFRNYRATVNACFYVPLAQSYRRPVSLEVRTAGDPMGLAAAIRREIHALDKDLLVPGAETLRSYRDAGLGQERLSAALLSGLGPLAVVLAAVGLYGVLAFAVAQRTREIGVRMALGARAGQVLRGVMKEALVLLAAGLGLGLAGAAVAGRFISSLLFEVTATDPATYAVTVGVLTGVGAMAALIPARRAAWVDPMVALRYE